MKKFSLLLSAMAIAAASPSQAANIIDQNAPANTVFMAQFNQNNLAQSFQQTAGNVSGAGYFLQNGVGSGLANLTIGLWTLLPNQPGASLLASASGSTSTNNRWFDVFWPAVTVTPGATYFLVFSSSNGSYGISGDTSNGYANGNTFANSGFQSFAGFDYTFRTYSDDSVLTGAVPEPATWLMMILGFGMVGGAMRYRQRHPAKVTFG
jgi:hypothetical protein